MTRVRLACAALVLWISAAMFPASQSRPLDVYWIDAEGGAATLIVTPAGESILIDAGYPDERGAPRIHKVAKEIAGLQRIDRLIVTHFHNDHFGGAAALQKLMPIGEVYDNGSPEPAERITPLFETYRAAFPKARLLKPGDQLPLRQAPATAGLTMRLVATRQQFVPAPAAAATPPACRDLTTDPPDTSDNANSTAWVLQLGDFRFFDAGDLTWNTEAANYIRMRVEPDGRRYSIEIPANGHRQSYEATRKGTR